MTFNKKLLFSGCSYTAGDEIVWDKYCKDMLLTKPVTYTWDYFHKEYEVFATYYPNYVEYRKKFNIPGQVGNAFNMPVVDLSTDGNSNTEIALSVIKKLLEKTPEETKDFHVCVGWTSVLRRFKWFEKQREFVTTHTSHYTINKFSELHPYIKEAMINVSVYDHNLQFINDVMLLENFLKARGITYTFWLSLSGMHGDNIEDLKEKLFSVIPIDKASDRKNWILFNTSDPIPMLGTSWTDQLFKKTNSWISSTNRHPNLKSATELAEKIVTHIQSRFLDKK
ncbi:MAG: hypothetical protein ACOVK2_01025 [Candidatus Fonsibacter sp.]